MPAAWQAQRASRVPVPEPEGRLRVHPRSRTESVVGFCPGGRRRYQAHVRRTYSEPCTSCGEEVRWHEWRPLKAGAPRSARRFLACAGCTHAHFLRLRAGMLKSTGRSVDGCGRGRNHG